MGVDFSAVRAPSARAQLAALEWARAARETELAEAGVSASAPDPGDDYVARGGDQVVAVEPTPEPIPESGTDGDEKGTRSEEPEQGSQVRPEHEALARASARAREQLARTSAGASRRRARERSL